jgi:hypothetical protein
MRMQKVTKEELESMNREGVRCAAELADARVDVMSTACLVAIMAIGLGYHRKMEEELTAAARANQLLAPVMTSAGALIEGLKTLGARRLMGFFAPISHRREPRSGPQPWPGFSLAQLTQWFPKNERSASTALARTPLPLSPPVHNLTLFHKHGDKKDRH